MSENQDIFKTSPLSIFSLIKIQKLARGFLCRRRVAGLKKEQMRYFQKEGVYHLQTILEDVLVVKKSEIYESEPEKPQFEKGIQREKKSFGELEQSEKENDQQSFEVDKREELSFDDQKVFLQYRVVVTMNQEKIQENVQEYQNQEVQVDQNFCLNQQESFEQDRRESSQEYQNQEVQVDQNFFLNQQESFEQNRRESSQKQIEEQKSFEQQEQGQNCQESSNVQQGVSQEEKQNKEEENQNIYEVLDQEENFSQNKQENFEFFQQDGKIQQSSSDSKIELNFEEQNSEILQSEGSQSQVLKKQQDKSEQMQQQKSQQTIYFNSSNSSKSEKNQVEIEKTLTEIQKINQEKQFTEQSKQQSSSQVILENIQIAQTNPKKKIHNSDSSLKMNQDQQKNILLEKEEQNQFQFYQDQQNNILLEKEEQNQFQFYQDQQNNIPFEKIQEKKNLYEDKVQIFLHKIQNSNITPQKSPSLPTNQTPSKNNTDIENQSQSLQNIDSQTSNISVQNKQHMHNQTEPTQFQNQIFDQINTDQGIIHFQENPIKLNHNPQYQNHPQKQLKYKQVDYFPQTFKEKKPQNRLSTSNSNKKLPPISQQPRASLYFLNSYIKSSSSKKKKNPPPKKPLDLLQTTKNPPSRRNLTYAISSRFLNHPQKAISNRIRTKNLTAIQQIKESRSTVKLKNYLNSYKKVLIVSEILLYITNHPSIQVHLPRKVITIQRKFTENSVNKTLIMHENQAQNSDLSLRNPLLSSIEEPPSASLLNFGITVRIEKRQSDHSISPFDIAISDQEKEGSQIRQIMNNYEVSLRIQTESQVQKTKNKPRLQQSFSTKFLDDVQEFRSSKKKFYKAQLKKIRNQTKQRALQLRQRFLEEQQEKLDLNIRNLLRYRSEEKFSYASQRISRQYPSWVLHTRRNPFRY